MMMARPSAAQAVPDARRTWLADCAVCHGADGRGTPFAPSLSAVGRADVDYELSTGRMPLVVPGRVGEKGTPKKPLVGSHPVDPGRTVRRHTPAYDVATIDALVRYIGELVADGGPEIPSVGQGSTAAGGELFRENCASCHAWSADGGALYHREAPGLHDAASIQVAEAVRVGPGQMPAFGTAALTSQQLNDVIRYVRYLDHPEDRGGQPLHHLGPVAEGAVGLAALALLLWLCLWIGERERQHP